MREILKKVLVKNCRHAWAGKPDLAMGRTQRPYKTTVGSKWRALDHFIKRKLFHECFTIASGK